MNIPDEAVQAASKRIDEYYDTPNCVGETAVRAALTAALPFLQGVKVKALEWDGQLAKTQFGNYTYDEEDRGWRYTFHDYPYGIACDDYYPSEAEVVAAAQADYEARILSAIEPAPSPRLQAEAIIAAKVEQGRLRFEGDLDKWMKMIGAGITGYQPEAYALMDLACQELVKLREENTSLRSVSSQAVENGLPQDVINLVIAAREFWEDHYSDLPSNHAMDEALEAFSSRVLYENEPEALPASPGASE